MNDNRTPSMLQRLPAILAVTAHSFGLAPGVTRTRRGPPGNPSATATRRSGPARAGSGHAR